MVEGIEPINNAAERAIRPEVQCQKTGFASQSETGSVFVARMLTGSAEPALAKPEYLGIYD